MDAMTRRTLGFFRPTWEMIPMSFLSSADYRLGGCRAGGLEFRLLEELELVKREADQQGAQDPGFRDGHAVFQEDVGIHEDVHPHGARGDARPPLGHDEDVLGRV